MVAGGHRVVAHGPHGAQLRPLGGVQGLDQRTDGEVTAVQSQSVWVAGPLPVQSGFQPGVAAGFSSAPVGLGQKVGVEIMGKQHRSGMAPRQGRPSGQQGKQQQKRQQTGG